MLIQERRGAPDHARYLALTQIFRPAVGFNRPEDVLKDPVLSDHDKREILSSWASDACAVPGRPGLRLLPGSDVAVPRLEVLEALARVGRAGTADETLRPRRSGPDQRPPSASPT